MHIAFVQHIPSISKLFSQVLVEGPEEFPNKSMTSTGILIEEPNGFRNFQLLYPAREICGDILHRYPFEQDAQRLEPATYAKKDG